MKANTRQMSGCPRSHYTPLSRSATPLRHHLTICGKCVHYAYKMRPNFKTQILIRSRSDTYNFQPRKCTHFPAVDRFPLPRGEGQGEGQTGSSCSAPPRLAISRSALRPSASSPLYAEFRGCQTQHCINAVARGSLPSLPYAKTSPAKIVKIGELADFNHAVPGTYANSKSAYAAFTPCKSWRTELRDAAALLPYHSQITTHVFTFCAAGARLSTLDPRPAPGLHFPCEALARIVPCGSAWRSQRWRSRDRFQARHSADLR
jgi:hypothetical protein